MTTRLTRELASLGARPTGDLDVVAAGPFAFAFTITTGATTASDLTLEAQCKDDELRRNYGFSADNPQVMLHIEGISATMDFGAETTDIVNELSNQVAIHHQAAGGRSRSINLAGLLQSSGYVASDDGAGVVSVNKDAPRIYTLPTPWSVNCNTDTFEVLPTSSIASAANVLGGLVLYGFAWAVPQGVPDPISCPDGQTAAALSAALRMPPEVTR